MFNFHINHKNLVIVSGIVFAGLSMFIAVIPANNLQQTKPLPNMQPLPENVKAGLYVYISENCMSCHTQQVRNIEMDKIWGDRPSMASEYYYSKKRPDLWRQSPSLLGSERTGPDLTNIAKRQSGAEWHLIHLYNPRIVVNQSIMPSYPWLFIEKNIDEITETDVVVPVPKKYLINKENKIVATENAINLVAYLQSLKQPEIDGNIKPNFISARKKQDKTEKTGTELLPNGAQLFLNTCAACHQANGTGIPGAFPALSGSSIVNDENPETLIRIILTGYDARAEYGVMAGFAELLTDEEIAAIANHERSSWGNNAPAVSVEDVNRIRTLIKAIE
jgi:cytochrome c oxidase cbb3-type subunit 2